MNGAAHYKANVIFGVLSTGVALASQSSEIALPVFVGCLVGTWITPDYDLDKNLPASPLTRIPVVKTLWRGMWRPYQEIVKHRSFFSHFPIVGTLMRFFYILAWVLAFLWIASSLGFGPTPGEFLEAGLKSGAFVIIVLVFWCVQDFIHFLLDL